MFYVQVTDAMKTEHGGGNPDEGEMIEIVEVPVSESLQLAISDDVERPMGLVFAILWFFKFKATTSTSAQKGQSGSTKVPGVKK